MKIHCTKSGGHQILYENLANNQGHALYMHSRGVESERAVKCFKMFEGVCDADSCLAQSE